MKNLEKNKNVKRKVLNRRQHIISYFCKAIQTLHSIIPYSQIIIAIKNKKECRHHTLFIVIIDGSHNNFIEP